MCPKGRSEEYMENCLCRARRGLGEQADQRKQEDVSIRVSFVKSR